MLRGPHRHDTTIKATTIEPSWIKVTLGKPKELNTGDRGVTQIPLSVEIPPDAPPVNHLGTDQGEYAKVIFETTNPDAKQIKMYLQFVVIQ